MSTDPVDHNGDTKMALIKKLRAMLRERDGELNHLRRRLVELEGAGEMTSSGERRHLAGAHDQLSSLPESRSTRTKAIAHAIMGGVGCNEYRDAAPKRSD